MDTQGYKVSRAIKNAFTKNGLMQKTVASLVTVFFIFSGIPMPASFAGGTALFENETQRTAATVTLDQANARGVSAVAAVPSGAAFQNTSALSAAYDPSQVTVLPGNPSVGSGVGSGGGTVVSGTLQTQQSSSRNLQLQYNNLDADDFAFVYVTAGTTMDLRNGINVGLNGVSGKQLKLELKDAFGNVAAFYLTLTGSLQNYVISSANLQTNCPQLDATRIREVVFVMDRAHMGTSGSVAIETAGLAYTPSVPVITTPTPQPVTDLSQYQPSASSVEAVPGTTVMGFTQTSANEFSFNYNLSAGGSQRWAAAQIFFPSAQSGQPFNLPAGGVVLNVAVTGASYYKLEFNDINGNKVAIRVNVTNGSVLVTDAILQSAGVAGFDSTKIQAIVVVVDDPMAATGVVKVITQGLQYTPVVIGNVYNPALLTSLPNQPELSSSNSFTSGTITLTQTSSQDFSFAYALPQNGDFVYASLGKGYFDRQNSNVWMGQTMSFGGVQAVFAVNGPAGKQLKVEVVDANDVRAVYYLNLTGSFQNYTLDFNGRGIDPAHIAQIIFTAEKAKMGASGGVAIQTKGLNYIPVISGAIYNASQVTVFPNRPVVSSGIGSAGPGGSVNGTLQVLQPSNSQFVMNYTLADNDDFVFAHIGDGFFNNGGGWIGTSMNLGTSVTFGVNGPAGKQVKVEVVDRNGVRAVYYLNLTGLQMNYTLNLQGMGIDTTNIVQIVFVADKTHMGSAGQVQIQAKGLSYTPVITTPTAQVVTDFGALSPTASPVEAFQGTTVSNFVQPNANEFSFNYNLPAGGDQRWAAGMILFNGGPLFDMRASGIVLGVYLTGASYYKLEVQDVNGVRVTVQVRVTNGKVLVTDALLQAAGVAGFDSSKVRTIVVVVDDPQATVGTVRVMTQGLKSEPTVPEGWTRAAGNGNFAFQTRTSSEPRPGRFNYSLYLKDLRTGTEISLDSFGEFTGVSSVGNKVYVSQDGNSVFYSRNVYGGVGFGDGWEVVLRSSSGSRAVLHGTLDNVQFLSQSVAEVTMTFQGVQRSYNVELSTGYIVLPEGWTRAGSNSFYAFRETQAGSQLVLSLMDLRTGAVLELGRADIGGAYPQHFDGYDVLSDGSAAIFGTTRMPYGSSTYVRQLEGSGQLTLNGRVTASTYDSVAHVLRLDLENTVPVNPSWSTRTVLVDMNSFSSLTSIYAGNAYEVFQSDQAYYVLVEGHLEKVSGINPADGTVIVEAVRASHDLIYFHWKKGATDIYQLYNMMYSYPSGMFVSITAQEYLQGAIPLVPEGWTRAASNARYAYQIVFFTDPSGMNYFRLETMDLLSGKSVVVRQVRNVPGGEDFTGFVDIAPGGKYVVYEVAYARGSYPKTVEIFNLETQAVLSVSTNHAMLMGVEFSATHIKIHTDAVEVDHVVKGTYVVNLADGSQVFIPDIPTLAVGQFQAGGCAVAEHSTSVSSTACVGLVGTPNGTVEIHSYNQRNNTGLTIYNAAQQEILSYSVASPARLDAITQLNVSSDGKYLVVAGPVNAVSVLSLTVPSSYQSVMIPPAAGSSTPWVGSVKFITATRILATMDDGSNRQFYVDIGSTGQLTLTPRVATPTVTAGTPTSAGALTLKGAKAASTSIWYSMDGGVTYKQLVYTSSATTWSGTVTLPVGSTTILVQSRMTVVVSGVSTVIFSTPASVGPIVYTAPTVAVPTVTAGTPTSAGALTLKGAKPANTSIWYSMDGGVTYKQLVSLSSATTWTGTVTLPVGSTTILVQARMTAVVSGVSTVISSTSASVGPIIYTAPTVATPTVTAGTPTSAGAVTLKGVKAANTSIWYSMDGGVTYKQLVYSSSATTWSGTVTLPVGSTTILVQARMTAVVSGVSTVISSTSASVGPIVYTAPTVAAPTVTATTPSSRGVVTLKGTKAANTSIWYSVDGGVTYKPLIYVSSTTSWTGNITVPVGSTAILVQARMTAVVSGVSTVISSTPAQLTIVRS